MTMRSHLCGEIGAAEVEQSVRVCGWVLNRRDHGGVIFLDLRDRSGRVQIVADPDQPQPFAAADAARNEFVLRVEGRVRRRPAGTENPELATGALEILADAIEVLGKSEALPFQLDETELGEAVRLTYRFLDLRRARMQKNLALRHQMLSAIRNFLNANQFMEIETPILTRSTPEGARDYLVPSRTRLGEFFALPQSPQLFKQLLMVSGFERYYQIARCFRDEDLRADRQPEFTQLDLEMSFVDEADVMRLVEQMLRRLFDELQIGELPAQIPKMSYKDALADYGDDRPDLRIAIKLIELTDLMRDVEFKVFSAPANSEAGRVAALCAPGGANFTRAQIDDYTAFVADFGAKGLAYIKVGADNALQSPILKFLPAQVQNEIIARTQAKPGDLIFFGAGDASVVNASLSALRLKLARDLDLVAQDWRPLWVTDFPLLEWNPDAKRWQAMHHPFTSPQDDDATRLRESPGKVLSRAYDLVLNGVEIGGGSIRIHRPELQLQVLDALGIDAGEAQKRFGFLLNALRYGAPPHGGIAFGLDRMAAMFAGEESIRDVIAFPKTQKAACLLTDAPSEVDVKQLRELGVSVKKPRAEQ